MAAAQLWSNTDEYLRVEDLYDPVSRTRFFAALIRATLRDSRGGEVPGITWPQTLAVVPGVKGAFRGLKAGGLSLVKTEPYTIDIRAEAGATIARWIIKRTPSLKYASSSAVIIRPTAFADTADVFGSVVVGQVRMTMTAFDDTADTFGTVTVNTV